MSAAKPGPALAPIGAALHRRLGLLEGWSFYRVPLAAGLQCLCRRPAAYATGPDGEMALCVKHATRGF